MGLNGFRAENMKRTVLDFSYSVSKKEKIAAVKEQENEEEVVSVEDDGLEAEDVSLGTSVSVQSVTNFFL